MDDVLTAAALLPAAPPGGPGAALAGRVWRPDAAGPAVAAFRPAEGGGWEAVDISRRFPTMRDLCEELDPAAALRGTAGESLGTLDAILANTDPQARDPARPWLLTPIDLQAVKAAGVTFVVSMLERVIEEQAKGDPAAAPAIRRAVLELAGGDLKGLVPGSAAAARFKELMVARGAWSPYLEVGLGPDAEIFTKAQPMSSVGPGDAVGLHPMSSWNNPEPEVVLAVASTGRIVAATLGNDVNLRDVEGRSALLLGKAKDNNASCAVGPALRFFDEGFTLDDVRRLEVTLEVRGADGFVLNGRSSLAEISRDPADLVAQMIGPHHQYPDGAALFLGTMFAPIEDRDAPGQGFTHHLGDIVTIATPALGRLVNRVALSTEAPPWRFGAGALMRNLARRGLL